MNLVFLHPELLILPAVLAVAGWFLLRTARKALYSFTILEFWPAETPHNAGTEKSRADWPWVLILAAAILAATALSAPRLQIAESKTRHPPKVALQARGRSLPGNNRAVDLFIRAPGITGDSRYRVVVTTLRHQFQRRVSGATIQKGIDISPITATRRMDVTLQQTHQTVAHLVLRRSSGVRTIAAHFIGTPPAAFLRLFAALPEVTPHDDRPERAIWIIHQRQFNPAIVRGITDSTFVLLGNTPGPGLKPIMERTVTTRHSLRVDDHNSLMQAVDPKGVLVRKIVIARRDSHWHTLINYNGHAWLAERHDRARGQTWLWLAGRENSPWSTWADHASFVIFFANVIAELQQLPGPDAQMAVWRPSGSGATGPTPLPRPMAATGSINVNIGLALLACALLLTAVSALAWRGCTTEATVK